MPPHNRAPCLLYLKISLSVFCCVRTRAPLLCCARYGFWQGPIYPNSSRWVADQDRQCINGGCLFDIYADPTEHNNLADEKGDLLATMRQKWYEEFRTSVVAADYGYSATTTQRCLEFVNVTDGFVGPFCSRFRNSLGEVQEAIPFKSFMKP